MDQSALMYSVLCSSFRTDIHSKVQGRDTVTAASLKLEVYAKRFLAASRSLRQGDKQPKSNPVQSCAAAAPVQQNGSGMAGGITAGTYAKRRVSFPLLIISLFQLSSSKSSNTWILHNRSKISPWMLCSFALFSLTGCNCAINHRSVKQLHVLPYETHSSCFI